MKQSYFCPFFRTYGPDGRLTSQCLKRVVDGAFEIILICMCCEKLFFFLFLSILLKLCQRSSKWTWKHLAEGKHGDGFSNKKQHRHVLLGCCRWTFPDPSQAIVHWPCMWQVSHRAIRIMLFKSVQSRSSIVNRMLVTINKLLHLFFFFPFDTHT